MSPRRARILAGLLLAAGLLLTAACSAHNDTDGSSVSAPASATSSTKAAVGSYTEGKQYVRIKSTQQASGPVAVVEVFSYACPHCAEFAPHMDKLRASLPKGVQVRYMPAIFSPAWEPYARAFYAAKQLGVLDQTHDALFKAMQENYPLNSLEDLAAFYARHGVDRQKFLDTANSRQTDAMIDADQALEKSWGIDATPTLVVGHLQGNAPDAPMVADYRSNEVQSFDELAKLGDWMVKKEQK
ncbi:thiol:disulfide interchange protein DsbA/DsbL [Dyella sp.]|uniref:thiol:disulfide interchange protein DsbA/DsbL n=1 Tax=Dyella sp. TaxID=1869338 RepID=UPI002D79ACBD|nr:thiol:disulfide interchange protein DsbA/DsbL [Dyella sp.]HET7330640.1 thiol:disulfide interchange protein DsbA/DsbL [Dyella sp.]HET9835225.1 thiol:disulfide interchange protein DsbA/DsbL [Rhodanobacteraceae bacterium]